jgi:L-threonylcarbamoyladenylate synthase
MNRLPADDVGRREAIRILGSGGVVVLPTDTVYGLCADALDPAAVARVRGIKGREAVKPFPVLVADRAGLALLVPVGLEGALVSAVSLWPGPLTAVVRGRDDLPPGILGPSGGVGVRVPDADLVREISRALGRPLVGTSANPAGAPSPVTAEEVEAAFADCEEGPDLILDGGPCPGGTESTVVDLRGERPHLVRRGALSEEKLVEAFGPLA